MIPTTGKGIQCATSHNLGQNFSKMFEIQFESKSAKSEYAWQTSWGLTTRSIGVAVMTHSDSKGLVLPPKVAPLQIVIVPILKTEDEKDGTNSKIIDAVKIIFKNLKASGLRVKLDDRDNYKPGWKYNQWELKGVPVRVEFGKNEMLGNSAVLCTRDTGEKITCSTNGIENTIKDLLEKIHSRMFEKAKHDLYSNIKYAGSNEEFFQVICEKKSVKTMWCNNNKCEDDVKKMVKDTLVKIIEEKKQAVKGADEEIDVLEITAKTLCMPLEQEPIPHGQKCFACGQPAKVWVLWGKTY